jgi:hypothetical protein
MELIADGWYREYVYDPKEPYWAKLSDPVRLWDEIGDARSETR